MGIFFRKSIKVGPFRYNLSGSGIGVSVGFKGFRLGSGPRGNYVHMGQKGIYYRASLPGPARPKTGVARPAVTTPFASPVSSTEVLPAGFVVIESEWITTDSSADAILVEILEKQRKGRLAPWILGAALFMSMVGAFGGCGWFLAYFLLGAIAWAWALKRDAVAKAVVVGYHLEGEAEQKFQALCDASLEIAKARRIRAKVAVSASHDWKRNAGASRLLVLNPAQFNLGDPPTVKTNINLPILKAGKETLCFFPDRLIAFTPKGCFAVPYSDLAIEASISRFIEEEAVPSDAEVVDHTWKYVNKKGGPDKRFKDNRRLPILHVEDIRLSSSTGLNLCLQVSAVGRGQALIDAVRSA